MSNNGDVEYEGYSYFFTSDKTYTVADNQRDAVVGLTFTGAKHLLGKPGVFRTDPIPTRKAISR